MKIIFIVNPISGTKDKQRIIDLIPKFFDKGEYEYEIRRTERAGHAEEIARQAAEQGAIAAVAVGGDGTVNEVARGIVHTATALGIVPCGSGNGLARHLGIPMKAEGALEVLSRMDIRQCDYCKINGHPFFCTAGVGFDAQVSDTFAKAGKRGLPTYLKTTIGVGLRYQGESYEILVENDGKTERLSSTKPSGKEKRYWLITGANAAQYGNDFFIAPDASVCDGKLDVNIWTKFNKITSPLVGLRLATATIHHSRRHVRIVRCDKITIRRKSAGPIQWDGDPAQGTAEVVMECVAGGIKMVVGTPKRNKL
ncbi:MAG: diacylglycerol kinase family lipid kinase [Bacteroidales bacterium]|nr:diacylglycerol kinase family lipid kinase [Candidatus Physcousia equi]